jgi:hypothetical protein
LRGPAEQGNRICVHGAPASVTGWKAWGAVLLRPLLLLWRGSNSCKEEHQQVVRGGGVANSSTGLSFTVGTDFTGGGGTVQGCVD